MSEGEPEDTDFRSARENDAAVTRSAKRTLEALGLPKTRLPVLEREFRSIRDISQERVEHCRHMELLQEIPRIRNPDDDYRHDPERICSCRFHGYRSRIP